LVNYEEIMLNFQEYWAPAETQGQLHDIVQRRDQLTAAAVDRAIALQDSMGAVCALEYLLAYGVPTVVAQRVLCHRSKRRPAIC
jgi:hypothetical protein